MEDKKQLSGQAASLQAAIKRLQIFIGKWKTTGQILDKTGASVGQINATDTYEWLPGNYAVIHYADSNMGGEKIHGVEIIGYDPSRKTYFGPFFDNQGSAGSEEITNEANNWTWQGQNVMGVKHHRCRAVFSTDQNTLDAIHEQSDDGKNWLPWMEVQLSRIAE